MRFIGRLLGISTCVFASAALAHAPVNTEKVLVALHQANRMEIACGKLASSNAEASDVRAYGQQLVSDHTRADQQVVNLAKREHIALPDAGPRIAGDPDTMSDRLAKLSGADFDREFLRSMIQDHDQAIRQVKTAQASTGDPRLRALLKQLLPQLEAHRATALALAGER